MLKNILVVLMSLNLISAPEVTVDRIEDNNMAVIEVCFQNHIKMVDVPMEDFNNPIADDDKIEATAIMGSFPSIFIDTEETTYYQFKSYDDSVWWLLTAEEIGFEPEEDKPYTLIYNNNGTTDCTECAEEFDCECELYDDIFLAIY